MSDAYNTICHKNVFQKYVTLLLQFGLLHFMEIFYYNIGSILRGNIAYLHTGNDDSVITGGTCVTCQKKM